MITASEIQRWDLAHGIALAVYGDDIAVVWMATRTLYMSSIPSEDPSPER